MSQAWLEALAAAKAAEEALVRLRRAADALIHTELHVGDFRTADDWITAVRFANPVADHLGWLVRRGWEDKG